MLNQLEKLYPAATRRFFQDSIVRLEEAEKVGLCKLSGELILPIVYDDIIACGNYFILCKDNQYGLTDKEGKWVLPLNYSSIEYKGEDNFIVNEFPYLLNIKGEKISDNIVCDYISFEKAHKGFVKYQLKLKKQTLYGFIDEQGTELTKPIYNEVRNFNEGYAAVKKYGWGFINNKGKEVIPLIYTDVNDFYKGYSWVRDSKTYLWGVIDSAGAIVAPYIFNHCPVFDKDNAISSIKIDNRLEIFVNYKGEQIIKDDGKLIEITSNFGLVFTPSEGISRTRIVKNHKLDYSGWRGFHSREVYKEYKFGYINILGKEIVKPRYNIASDFNSGFAEIGIIPPKNMPEFLKKIQYKQYDNDGLVATEEEQETCLLKSYCLMGRINKKGELLVKNGSCDAFIPAKFDWGYDYKEGLSRVVVFSGESEDYYFIDLSGNVVLDCSKYSEVGDFSEGMAKVRLANKWGYINSNGTEIIPAVYDNAKDFCNGLAIVYIKDKRKRIFKDKWGRINKQGEIVDPIENVVYENDDLWDDDEFWTSSDDDYDIF